VSLFHRLYNLEKTRISRELELILVAAIFASSLLLRILFMGLNEFRADEAFYCWEAWQWINGGELPLRGKRMSVSNVYHGPLSTYLTA